ncbi:uncharacterized protein EKO05_0000465 [Ascochyta rabiei]|nr:uncharacterized protein EKO05_0000465 [Ascochyta rabiei]UPX09782.1 hypothetical protein EKO05_0000465 [Ascochyta rabiei]
MGDPYNSGHDQGYLHATGDGNLSNMINSNGYDPFQQQALINRNTHSSTTYSYHDSTNYQLSPQAAQYSPRQHQAKTHPCDAQLTPHTRGTLPYQSETMSRDPSHTSYRSSMSSGQQYGSPHFEQRNSAPGIWSSNRLDMQRSRSMYSDASTLHSQPINPHLDAPEAYQQYVDSYDPEPIYALATNFLTTTRRHSPNMHLDESVIDFFSNTTDVNLSDFGMGDIGRNAG